MGTANAAQTGQVTITCAKPDGTERTFPVGWDNSNQYFADKGDIARLFCEGGHSGGGYTVFVSTTVSDLSLRYYQGLVPSVPVLGPAETQTSASESQTSVAQDTVTTTSETQTPTVSETVTAPSTSDSQTPNLDMSDSSVVAPAPSSETQTVISEPVETVNVTSESSTQTSQQETTTSTIETPLPTPVPVVEPQPVPHPVAEEPQPLPQPLPEPAAPVVQSPVEIVQPSDPVVPVADPVISLPSENPEDVVPPSEEQPSEEQPVVEEQSPVEEPSEHPAEEDTNETPVEEPSIQEPSEPTPEPSPLPSAEPAPVIQPDTAYVPPTVTLDNGVILTQEVAEQVALLQDPGELLTELFTNPVAVFAALGSVGADMSPEARQESKDAVVQAVIVGGIVSQVAGATAYRRKP